MVLGMRVQWPALLALYNNRRPFVIGIMDDDVSASACGLTRLDGLQPPLQRGLHAFCDSGLPHIFKRMPVNAIDPSVCWSDPGIFAACGGWDCGSSLCTIRLAPSCIR